VQTPPRPGGLQGSGGSFFTVAILFGLVHACGARLPDFMVDLNLSTFRVDERDVFDRGEVRRLDDRGRGDAGCYGPSVRCRHEAKDQGARGDVRPHRQAAGVGDLDLHTFHQGHGSASRVRTALDLPTFAEALSCIDTTGTRATRLESVKQSVQVLLDENRFTDARLGEGRLSFDGADT
jgi:hypothetical protein